MVNCKTIRKNIRCLFSEKLKKDIARRIVSYRQRLALHRRISDHIDEDKCLLCEGYRDSVWQKKTYKTFRKTKG